MTAKHSVLVAILGSLLLLSCRRGDSTTTAEPDGSVGGAANALDAGPVSPEPPVTVPGCHDGFCLMKSGTYVMGSPPSEPDRSRFGEEQWDVTLTHPVLFGQHEVTQGEWAAMGLPAVSARHSVSGFTNCSSANCAADEINWCMAVEYLNRRSRAEGLQECIVLKKCHGTIGTDYFCDDYDQTTPSYYDCLGYRLPTSAEWQYAARAGTTTTFYSGPWNPAPGHDGECTDIPHLSATAWYCANTNNTMHEVMTRTPNPWGLFDMIGNANELFANKVLQDMRNWGPHTDPFADTKAIPNLDPRGTAPASYGTSAPYALRLATVGTLSSNNLEAAGDSGQGFRAVRTLPATQAARW